jgi:hypothetical protein
MHPPTIIRAMPLLSINVAFFRPPPTIAGNKTLGQIYPVVGIERPPF